MAFGQQTGYVLNASKYGSTADGAVDSNNAFNVAVFLIIPPKLDFVRFPQITSTSSPTSISDSQQDYLKSLRDRFRQYEKDNAPLRKRAREELRKAVADQKEAQTKYNRTKSSAAKERLKKANKALRKAKANYRSPAGSTKLYDANQIPLTKYSAKVNITEFVTSLSWSCDVENFFVSADLDLDNFDGMFNYIPEGAKIIIYTRDARSSVVDKGSFQNFKPYLVLYVTDLNRSAQGSEQKLSLTCRDRGSHLQSLPVNLNGSTKMPKFKKKTPAFITKSICKRIGFPCSPDLPKKVGGKKIPRVSITMPDVESAGDYIDYAWQIAMKKLGKGKRRPYAIHTRSGYLKVEFQKKVGTGVNDQKKVYVFDEQSGILNGELSSATTDQQFTVLIATGTIRKKKRNSSGKKVNKIIKLKGTFYPDNRLLLEAYGKKVKKENLGRFSSKAEFQTEAKSRINSMSHGERSFSFSTAGFIDDLNLWPLTYININSKYFGLRGNFPITAIKYTLSNGDLQLDMSIRLKESYIPYAAADKLYESRSIWEQRF